MTFIAGKGLAKPCVEASEAVLLMHAYMHACTSKVRVGQVNLRGSATLYEMETIFGRPDINPEP